MTSVVSEVRDEGRSLLNSSKSLTAIGLVFMSIALRLIQESTKTLLSASVTSFLLQGEWGLSCVTNHKCLTTSAMIAFLTWHLSMSMGVESCIGLVLFRREPRPPWLVNYTGATDYYRGATLFGRNCLKAAFSKIG